jgi:hypothetical protein
MKLGASNYGKRKASFQEDEALALQWLLEDGLPGVDNAAQIFLSGLAPTNAEVDGILQGSGKAVLKVFRQRALVVLSASKLDEDGIRVLTACSRYLSLDERNLALGLVKDTCEFQQDDQLLSEALASVRRFELPLWPDNGFRKALTGIVDHKRWAIADLAAEILASEQTGAQDSVLS